MWTLDQVQKLLEKLGLKFKQRIGQQYYFTKGDLRITWLENDTHVCIYRIGTALRASKPMIPLDNLSSGVRAALRDLYQPVTPYPPPWL